MLCVSFLFSEYAYTFHETKQQQEKNKYNLIDPCVFFYPYTVAFWQRTRKSNFAEKRQFVFVNFNWQSRP